MIRVELGKEIKPGIFEYRVPGFGDGNVWGRSRQPLLDACRLLKSLGASTASEIGMFREGRSVPDLKCILGKGAELTVSEPDRGRITFVKYRAFAGMSPEEEHA
jgi:hypothetical protein